MARLVTTIDVVSNVLLLTALAGLGACIFLPSDPPVPPAWWLVMILTGVAAFVGATLGLVSHRLRG